MLRLRKAFVFVTVKIHKLTADIFFDKLTNKPTIYEVSKYTLKYNEFIDIVDII